MPFQVSPKRHVLVVSCQGWVRDGRQFYTEVTESGEGPWQPLSERNQGAQSMQLLRFDEQRSRTVRATGYPLELPLLWPFRRQRQVVAETVLLR